MSLTAADLELHAKLRIPSDLLQRARVRRVSDPEAREVLGLNGKAGDFSGIEYPYLNPLTGHRGTSRVRRDHPEIENGKPKNKYMSGFGDNRHILFPTWGRRTVGGCDRPRYGRRVGKKRARGHGGQSADWTTRAPDRARGLLGVSRAPRKDHRR